MLHVSVSAYKQAEAERRSDPGFAERWAGEGFVSVPEGGVAVSSTRSPRVLM